MKNEIVSLAFTKKSENLNCLIKVLPVFTCFIQVFSLLFLIAFNNIISIFPSIYNVHLYRHSEDSFTFSRLKGWIFIPSLLDLKDNLPIFFMLSTVVFCFFAVFTNYFYCHTLKQRLKVPELKSTQRILTPMFILGNLSVIFYFFLGIDLTIATDLILFYYTHEATRNKITSEHFFNFFFFTFILFSFIYSSLSLYISVRIAKSTWYSDINPYKSVYLKVTINTLIFFLGGEFAFDVFSMPSHISMHLLFLLNSFNYAAYYFDSMFVLESLRRMLDKEFFV